MKSKVSSRNRYVSVLKMILRKMTGKEFFVEFERVEKKQPQVLNQELIERVEQDQGKHGTIIRLLLYTGVRFGELELVFQEYGKNPHANRIRYMMPKTLEERIIPLTDRIRGEMELVKFVPK